jgi:hypothetical protein
MPSDSDHVNSMPCGNRYRHDELRSSVHRHHSTALLTTSACTVGYPFFVKWSKNQVEKIKNLVQGDRLWLF